RDRDEPNEPRPGSAGAAQCRDTDREGIGMRPPRGGPDHHREWPVSSGSNPMRRRAPARSEPASRPMEEDRLTTGSTTESTTETKAPDAKSSETKALESKP